MTIKFIARMCGVLLGTLAQAACAQETAGLRKGIWDLKQVINGRPYSTRKCMQPYVDLVRQHEGLKDSGCTIKLSKPGDTTWQIDSRCTKADSDGRRWESASSTLIDVENEMSYKMQVKGTTNKVPMTETVNARWVGNCTE